MTNSRFLLAMMAVFATVLVLGCGSSDKTDPTPADGDGESETVPDGDSDSDTETEAEAEAESEEPVLPDKLAIEFTRPDVGTPVTPAEVTAFTKKLVAFFKKSDYFGWMAAMANGVGDAEGKKDWAIWNGGDVTIVKAQGKLTFNVNGGGHNNWIDNSKLLSGTIGAYLLTGDAKAGYLVKQLSKGLVATMKGMEFGQNDPDKYIMARNVVPVAVLETTLPDGRKKTVSYAGMFSAYDEWNTSRFENPNNPFWGDMWVTNKRSKDDTCHIYRMTAYLAYAAEYAKDADVKAAAAEAYSYMQGFTKDIFDHAYNIRTKGPDGKAVILAGKFADLGSYTNFDVLFNYNPECNAKVANDYIANGKVEAANAKCKDNGTYNSYEKIAVNQNHYELHIIRNFHMAAIVQALLHRDNAVALRLMKGLDDRINKDFDDNYPLDTKSDDDWDGQMAIFLLQSASLGLPLTSREVGVIHTQFGKTLDGFAAFSFYNPWDESVPDGTYSDLRPNSGDGHIDVTEVALAFEYCNSPFKNATGRIPIDCEIVKDPSKW